MHQIIFTQLTLLYFLNKTRVQAIKHMMHKINTVLLCRHLRCDTMLQRPLGSLPYLLATLQRPLNRCNTITTLQRLWFVLQYPSFHSQQPGMCRNIYASICND